MPAECEVGVDPVLQATPGAGPRGGPTRPPANGSSNSASAGPRQSASASRRLLGGLRGQASGKRGPGPPCGAARSGRGRRPRARSRARSPVGGSRACRWAAPCGGSRRGSGSSSPRWRARPRPRGRRPGGRRPPCGSRRAADAPAGPAAPGGPAGPAARRLLDLQRAEEPRVDCSSSSSWSRCATRASSPWRPGTRPASAGCRRWPRCGARPSRGSRRGTPPSAPRRSGARGPSASGRSGSP